VKNSSKKVKTVKLKNSSTEVKNCKTEKQLHRSKKL
jgi:hypothetical protein